MGCAEIQYLLEKSMDELLVEHVSESLSASVQGSILGKSDHVVDLMQHMISAQLQNRKVLL
jgi:hypothetical protein